MRFLLVDTADARGCLALVRDGALEGIAVHPAEDDYSSWLLPAVRRILAEGQLSLSDLDGYAVCSGPGSFTGLRVGLATVKAWAEINARPIAAVSRLEALAAASLAERGWTIPFVAAFLDARRSQVFAALFQSSSGGLEAVESESVTGLSDFVAKVDSHASGHAVLWITPDPLLLLALPAWPSRQAKGDVLQEVAPPFAPQLCAAAHAKFLRGKVTDALALDANYVRRSDAEIFWKGNPSAVKA